MVSYFIHPLDDCFERVRRADEHLADLEQRASDVFMQQANSVVIEFDPNPPGRIKNVMCPRETFFGMRFGVLIGEICYNLRSALDYLVFELAKHDSGAPQSATQFPIEDTKDGFERHAKGGRLKGINAAHVAAIERLQPYNRCNWTRRLRDCSNPDKHRHFVSSGGNFVAYAYSSIETDLNLILGPVRKAPHPIYGTVDVKVYITGNITFGDGSPVIETLEEIKSNVAQLLESFKPEF